MRANQVRRGTTLVEAILAMTILSMLLVPMVALFKVTHVLWRKFESGHGGVSSRQEIAFEVSRILTRARRLQSITDSQIQFTSEAGSKESLYQSGNKLIWERAGEVEVLTQEIGSIQFRLVEEAGEKLGQLIEVVVASRSDTSMAHAASVLAIWSNPGI